MGFNPYFNNECILGTTFFNQSHTIKLHEKFPQGTSSHILNTLISPYAFPLTKLVIFDQVA